MEIDFHYYCTAVLAKAAGFSRREALTIAYASQYVDDASENKPIQVGNYLFDPIRTAHNGLRGCTKKVQSLVHIPFHFIPSGNHYKNQGAYITRPNSNYSQYIVKKAVEEENHDFRLYRLGIAVHSLADTWSHQGFSGRRNTENDMNRIYLYKNGRWEKPFLKKIYLRLVPHVGHAEVANFPDKSHLKWKYYHKKLKKFIIRDNTKIFLQAAKETYCQLKSVSKNYVTSIIPWEKLQERLLELFSHSSDNLNEKCKIWKKTFKDWFRPFPYEYNRYQWRKEALGNQNPNALEWDSLSPYALKNLKFSMKKDFYHSSWVQFHMAALLQRNLVQQTFFAPEPFEYPDGSNAPSLASLGV